MYTKKAYRQCLYDVIFETSEIHSKEKVIPSKRTVPNSRIWYKMLNIRRLLYTDKFVYKDHEFVVIYRMTYNPIPTTPHYNIAPASRDAKYCVSQATHSTSTHLITHR